MRSDGARISSETIVPTMPFLFQSKEHMRKVLDGLIGGETLLDVAAACLRVPVTAVQRAD